MFAIESGIHYPQIQRQSGATGFNTLRIYNPIKQAEDNDPSGEFVARWSQPPPPQRPVLPMVSPCTTIEKISAQ